MQLYETVAFNVQSYPQLAYHIFVSVVVEIQQKNHDLSATKKKWYVFIQGLNQLFLKLSSNPLPITST